MKEQGIMEIQIPCENEYGMNCIICGQWFSVGLFNKKLLCDDCRETLAEIVRERRALAKDEEMR